MDRPPHSQPHREPARRWITLKPDAGRSHFVSLLGTDWLPVRSADVHSLDLPRFGRVLYYLVDVPAMGPAEHERIARFYARITKLDEDGCYLNLAAGVPIPVDRVAGSLISRGRPGPAAVTADAAGRADPGS